MRRGTQGHVAAPRGPAQRLRDALYILYNLFTILYKVLQLSLYGKGYSSLINRRVLYPDDITFSFPCGTNPHETYLMQVTWTYAERRIERLINRRASIAWSADHRKINRTCFNSVIITAVIDWRGSHLSRWIAIQGAKVKRFYNAY